MLRKIVRFKSCTNIYCAILVLHYHGCRTHSLVKVPVYYTVLIER